MEVRLARGGVNRSLVAEDLYMHGEGVVLKKESVCSLHVVNVYV